MFFIFRLTGVRNETLDCGKGCEVRLATQVREPTERAEEQQVRTGPRCTAYRGKGHEQKKSCAHVRSL